MQALKLRGILDLVSMEAELLLQIPSSMGREDSVSLFSMKYFVISFVPCRVMEEIVPDRGHHPTLNSRHRSVYQ